MSVCDILPQRKGHEVIVKVAHDKARSSQMKNEIYILCKLGEETPMTILKSLSFEKTVRVFT